MQVGDLVKFARAGRSKMATQVGIVISLKYKLVHKNNPWKTMRIAEIQWPHGGRTQMRADIFEVVSSSCK